MLPTLPPEIISHIVQDVAHDCYDNKSNVARLALVSRSFLHPTRVALYTNIKLLHRMSPSYELARDVIGNKDRRFVVKHGDEIAEFKALREEERALSAIIHTWCTASLLRTLQANHHIADLVRGVSFIAPEKEEWSRHCEVPALAIVMCFCHNLEAIDTEVTGGIDKAWSPSHIKNLIAKGRVPFKALCLHASERSDVDLFHRLPHLRRLGILHNRKTNYSRFFTALREDPPPASPSFSLDALDIDVDSPVETLVSAFSFLTANSSQTLRHLRVDSVNQAFPTSFSLSAFRHLTHVELTGAVDFLFQAIDIVSPLSNLQVFVNHFVSYVAGNKASTATVTETTHHWRRLPPSLRSLTLSADSFELSIFTALLEDAAFLPQLKHFNHYT